MAGSSQGVIAAIHAVQVQVQMSYSFQLLAITPTFAYAPDGRGPDSPEPRTISVSGTNLYGLWMECSINDQDTYAERPIVWISANSSN